MSAAHVYAFLVPSLCKTLPLFEEIYKRYALFILGLFPSSMLVQSVILHTITETRYNLFGFRNLCTSLDCFIGQLEMTFLIGCVCQNV